MSLAEIRAMPTTIGTGPNGTRIHESCFRSYQLLEKVTELLTNDPPCPQNVILEIIRDAMDSPHVTKEIGE